MVAALSMVSFADLTPARGTLLYSAPESQWRALTGYDDTPYGFAADTWSIGVIIFEVAAAEKFCKLVPDNTSHAAAIISVLWQRLGAPPLEGPWTNTKAGAEWIAGYVVDDSTNAVSPLCEIVSPARDLLSMLVKWVPAARASAAVAMQCAWFGETAGANAAAARARWYQAGNDGRHGCGCARPAEFQDGCYAPSCGCGAAGALNTSWPS